MTSKVLLEYLMSLVATVAAALIIRWLRARPVLVFWFPHEFLFNLGEEKGLLRTHSITVQNVGREPAEDVEVIHSARPDFMSIQPSLAYEEGANPEGNHVLRVRSLGPKEHFYLQMLTYKTTTPALLNVRFKAGQAKAIPVHLQRVGPKWAYYLVVVLLALGASVIVYCLYKGIAFAGKAAGLW